MAISFVCSLASQQARPTSQMRMQHRRVRRRRRRREIRGQLGDRALSKRGQDAFPHPPQRIAHVALRKLVAGPFVGRARRHRDRTVDRLDDVGHRNLRAASAPADNRRAFPAARPAGRAEPAAEGPWPATRSGCRTARRFPARSTRRCRLARPGASSPSARNPLFSKVSTYPTSRSYISMRISKVRTTNLNTWAGSDRPCRSSPGSRP